MFNTYYGLILVYDICVIIGTLCRYALVQIQILFCRMWHSGLHVFGILLARYIATVHRWRTGISIYFTPLWILHLVGLVSCALRGLSCV
jgi:hypothetical protein